MQFKEFSLYLFFSNGEVWKEYQIDARSIKNKVNLPEYYRFISDLKNKPF